MRYDGNTYGEGSLLYGAHGEEYGPLDALNGAELLVLELGPKPSANQLAWT